MNAMALYGDASAGLLLGAGVSFLPIRRRKEAAIVTAFLAAFTVAPFLYGLVGPVSFTLTQLALLRILAPEQAVVKGRMVAGLLVAFAVVFYPLALGVGSFDPFDLGYQPRLLLMLMIPVGVWLAWRRQHLLLVIIGLDLFSYGLGLFDNLWSALFDPILIIIAGIRLATKPLAAVVEVDAWGQSTNPG